MRDTTNYWRYFGFAEAPFAANSHSYDSDFASHDAIVSYIETRTREAEGPLRPLFRPSAIKVLERSVDGTRAMLDTLCQEALEAAFKARDLVVTGPSVEAALAQFKPVDVAITGPSAEKALDHARVVATEALGSPRLRMWSLVSTVAVTAFTLGLVVGTSTPGGDSNPTELVAAEGEVVRPAEPEAGLRMSDRLSWPSGPTVPSTPAAGYSRSVSAQLVPPT